MREGNFLEQPQKNQSETPERVEFELDKKDIADANAIVDDWDQYMAKSESMPEEKQENLSVQEMEEIVEIEAAQKPIIEPAKDESAPESVPISDEAPAQNAETTKTKVEQEVTIEPVKEERQAESAPASGESSVENKEKKEMGEIVIDKEKITDLINAGRKLARAFRERDEEKLNPLIEERDISPLVASFDNLHMLIIDDKQTVNGDELNHAIKRIANTIQNIGNVPRGQSMRDDVESLGKVVFYLEEVGDEAHDLGIFLSRKKENRPEEILQALRRLENTIKDKRDFVARKRNALS